MGCKFSHLWDLVKISVERAIKKYSNS